MDKKRFVETAHLYYALRIVEFFERQGQEAASEQTILEATGYADENGVDEILLEKKIIFDKAIKWLEENELIEIIRDDFGPEIVNPVLDLTLRYEGFFISFDFYRNYKKIQRGFTGWLISAILKLNATYDQLGITQEDVENPDHDWEPLPLDRDSPELQKAIEAIDEAIEAVRSDNGYSASLPEERDAVLTALQSASNKLKDAQVVSVAYLKVFVIPPIESLISRFKDNAKELIFTGAKQAVIELIKMLIG